jgi:Aldo/keto reductase family
LSRGSLQARGSRGYAVGSAVLEAILPPSDGVTAIVPIAMGNEGLDRVDGDRGARPSFATNLNGKGIEVETITLNNGVEMPGLGLGVFQTPPDETRDAVRAALGAGYRHIDTAAAYGNERQVGEAVHDSDLDRSEVFLETKTWISDYGYHQTLHGFEKSARKLDVDQIDLLILHQALPSAFDRTLEAYRGLETLLADGKGPRNRGQQLHG